MSQDLDGWGATDMPSDGNASDGESEERAIPKLVKAQNMKKNKSGGFQVMGLSRPVLQGILRKGYKIPTPIQRKAIPLILEGKDVVAMARTGSGKTAAFLVPLFEKLKIHSARVGARALIISPTRELALQTLTFAKELGKFTGLRAATILGGENIESQFAAIHENPDIIIATPGRFTHICVEMKLKLDTVEFVIFDEADRLFEMGFQEQLDEVIRRLSSSRQTVLFSATLPKILVDFARAGLSDPILIRLDTETKLSENLKLGFFKVNTEDKVSLLIYVLNHVIQPSESTVLFVPTKQFVDYLYEVLSEVGISCTYVFSSLDPAARKANIAKFRVKKVNVLIVTDLAARGIDIPFLDNVINFNFPPKAKLFVHRVGRVARAGRSGTAYSFVSPDELCYLLDLNMFLSQSIHLCPLPEESDHIRPDSGNWDKWFGKVPQEVIDDGEEAIRKLSLGSFELNTLKRNADNGFKKYVSTRPVSSTESIRRLKNELWGRDLGIHPIFLDSGIFKTAEVERMALLEKLKNVRPKRTIFEIKKVVKKDADPTIIFMEEKRKADEEKIKNHYDAMERRKSKVLEDKRARIRDEQNTMEVSSEADLSNTFSQVVGKRKKEKKEASSQVSKGSIKERFSRPPSSQLEQTNANKNTYIPYAPSDHYEEQGYSVLSNFEKDSSRATMDLIGDENKLNRNKPQSRWDRKRKKFININQEKKIKTESGAWVSASYKKNLYEKWRMRMQPNQKETEEQEEDTPSGDKSGWRTKKGGSQNKSKGFVSLTEAGGYKNKPHPLAVKNKGGTTKAYRKKGPPQLLTYEQKTKRIKQKKKKLNSDKRRQKMKQKKAQSGGSTSRKRK